MLAAAAVKFKISQTMILRRLGNKSKIAMDIQTHFPQHKIYIEPFFGAGGMFFNKPKVHHNVLNDIDSDVFNLFQVVSNQSHELKAAFKIMPIHSDLLEYWKANKETEPIKKALRFLFLSSYVYLGTSGTLALNAKKNEYPHKFDEYVDICSKKIFGCQFANYDFRKFINSISFIEDGRDERGKTLIYCDPPYLETGNNYSHSFTENDVVDLFDCLENTGCSFCYSEFNHTFILEQATRRGLNIIELGERRNIKNKRTEILVTNYKKPLSLFDGV
jgi:DNA adenine methylase